MANTVLLQGNHGREFDILNLLTRRESEGKCGNKPGNWLPVSRLALKADLIMDAPSVRLLLLLLLRGWVGVLLVCALDFVSMLVFLAQLGWKISMNAVL